MGCTGVDKHQNCQIIWSIVVRPSSCKKLDETSWIVRVHCKIEYAKAQCAQKVEHPFRVIKRHFGYTKVRFRRRSKNTGQQAALFTLANSWGGGRKRLPGIGKL
ncbi:ISPssy, transposase, partial [Pseudomonas amygdali pv. aesculi str. 0893_23]